MLRSGGLFFLSWKEKKRIDLQLQRKQQWIQSQGCSCVLPPGAPPARALPCCGRRGDLPPSSAAKTEDILQVSGWKKSQRSAFRHTSPSSGLDERACMPKTCLFLKLDSLVYLFIWSGTVSRGQCGSAHTQVEVGAGGLPSGRGGNLSWICWSSDFSYIFQLSRPFGKRKPP